MTASVVRFENVSRKFIIHHQKVRSFQEALVNLIHHRNGTKEEFWALKDVSFDVKRGEMLGIIGENGSGKSTALKIITRILEPTSGSVDVNGRVSALIELGAGFHPDLSGRENIYLNGSILGFSRREIDCKFRDIVAFAELEQFIDTPVKHYSSGMYMRLGFAVAINVDPDILIIDEVLAVGDEAFQLKCLDKINEFRRAGKTIILVSHALPLVESLCDRVVWLHHGEVRAVSAAAPAIQLYRDELQRHDERNRHLEHQLLIEEQGSTLTTSGETSVPARITRTALFTDTGEEKYSFRTGDTVVLQVSYVAEDRSSGLTLVVELRRSDGLLVHACSQEVSLADALNGDGENVVALRFSQLPLLAGSYELAPHIVRGTTAESAALSVGPLCRFSIWTDEPQHGLVTLHHEWQPTKRASATIGGLVHIS